MNPLFPRLFEPALGRSLPLDILRRCRPHATPESTSARQMDRLRSLLRTARDNVPYYRRLLMQAGVDPSSFKSPGDLRRIPVTTKRDIRRHPSADFLSRRSRQGDLLRFQTSGATGIPLTVYQSRYENLLLLLIKARTLMFLGLRLRDKMIRIRRRAYERRPAAWRFLQSLGLLCLEAVDSETPERIADSLRGKRADVLMGYTGSLARAGRILSAEGDMTLRPRFLVGGSETMTPFLRAQIEGAFGAPVRDTYICQETGMIAWECPASGLYHVAEDSLIVELLKDGAPCGPGETGEVVVTNLLCRSMPFIRYNLEDLATLASRDCPCGRRGLSFKKIMGKRQDYFRLADGKEFNPWDISGLWMGRAPWILQFELVQEQADSVVMRIVPTRTPPPEEVDMLADESRRLLGRGADFRVEFVHRIEAGAGGKFHVHRSLVRSIH